MGSRPAILLLSVGIGLALAPAATCQADAKADGESFVGQLVYLDAGDRMARFVLSCDAVVPASEDELREAATGNAQPLWNLPQRGALQIANRPAIPVVIVQSRPTASGRQVIAVTDRPIMVVDGWSGRTDSRPAGAVILELGADGTGEGTLLPEATVSVADGTATVANAGSPALRLIRVTTSR